MATQKDSVRQVVQISAPNVCAREGISMPTLNRWAREGRHGFPKPIYIGRHRFWRVDELEEWEKAVRDRQCGRPETVNGEA